MTILTKLLTATGGDSLEKFQTFSLPTEEPINVETQDTPPLRKSAPRMQPKFLRPSLVPRTLWISFNDLSLLSLFAKYPCRYGVDMVHRLPNRFFFFKPDPHTIYDAVIAFCTQRYCSNNLHLKLSRVMGAHCSSSVMDSDLSAYGLILATCTVIRYPVTMPSTFYTHHASTADIHLQVPTHMHTTFSRVPGLRTREAMT